MKSKKLITSIGLLASTVLLSACTSTGIGTTYNTQPPKPTDKSCKDWDYDVETGTWVCDESTSRYYGHYYHGGMFHSSKSGLMASSSYKSYKGSSSYSGKSSSFSKGSSGFGSSSSSSSGG